MDFFFVFKLIDMLSYILNHSVDGISNLLFRLKHQITAGFVQNLRRIRNHLASDPTYMYVRSYLLRSKVDVFTEIHINANTKSMKKFLYIMNKIVLQCLCI